MAGEKRSTKENAILSVNRELSDYGISIQELRKKTGLAWETVNNSLNILIGLNLVYVADNLYYALFHRPKDIMQQLESMNKILERKDQYINQLELRLAQLKFQKKK